MFGEDTEIGWIYALKYSPNSLWGSVTEFYEYVYGHKSNKKGIITFDCKVWGKFHQKNFTPKKGDGIAFYHSKGAKFPHKDPYKKKQRISLIGKLNDIKYNGQKLEWIKVSVEHKAIKILEAAPIVRDPETNHIFENCGIVSGPPASLYKADKKEWKEILTLLRERFYNTNEEVLLPEEIAEPQKYSEGAGEKITVNSYERNREARKECIRHHGFNCKVCGFNFEKEYGEVGKDFIHVHHMKPLSEIGDGYKIDPVKEMCPVCPNCHSIIHRNDPPYTIKEVKTFLKVKRKGWKGTDKKN